MNARDMVKGSLITLLNRTLDNQGMRDVRVVNLSEDFQKAEVVHTGKGERNIKGWIQAEIILPAPVLAHKL